MSTAVELGAVNGGSGRAKIGVDSCHMLCGVAVGDLNMDARMLLSKVAQQVGEKAGCQQGENPYAQMAYRNF